ncbi:MAG: DMT family transporter [Pseudomonadota bacterium]
MLWFAGVAILGGVLVSLSRQINGRLSLSLSALHSSYWNHLVGLLAVTAFGLAFGGLFVGDPWGAPWWAYLGGPIGFVFIAASSWAITRIGAAQTALLIIAGQMVFGVIVDVASGTAGDTSARVLGVVLILAGMIIARTGSEKTLDKADPND